MTERCTPSDLLKPETSTAEPIETQNEIYIILDAYTININMRASALFFLVFLM